MLPELMTTAWPLMNTPWLPAPANVLVAVMLPALVTVAVAYLPT